MRAGHSSGKEKRVGLGWRNTVEGTAGIRKTAEAGQRERVEELGVE
jgi:hypothetical protein